MGWWKTTNIGEIRGLNHILWNLAINFVVLFVGKYYVSRYLPMYLPTLWENANGIFIIAAFLCITGYWTCICILSFSCMKGRVTFALQWDNFTNSNKYYAYCFKVLRFSYITVTKRERNVEVNRLILKYLRDETPFRYYNGTYVFYLDLLKC